METSNIQKFYVGQTIFLTGGTGFLGKVFIEKLLRVCFDLRKIYILVRTKKGKSEDERFKEIFEAHCFDSLKELRPNFLEKVSLVYGDCSKPDLGLSQESKQMLIDEVTTIFHIAATVRFDQHLRTAAYINVRAVMDLIQMAKQMPQLRAFVHISTAFSHSPRTEIKEEFYDPPLTAKNLLNVVNSLDDDTITDLTPKLIKQWPNSYVFTKCIAESVIEHEAKELPTAVVRPGIVIISAKEPMPGWIDNFYGTNGVVAGAGLGLIRVLKGKTKTHCESVPVDYVVSNSLAAAWNIENQRNMGKALKEIPIYNFVLSSFVKFNLGQLTDTCRAVGIDYPPSRAIWHYVFFYAESDISFAIFNFFLHTVPAYIIDFVLLCMGKKRIAVEGYQKIKKFIDVLAYFSSKSWNFDSQNVKNLFSIMSKQDQELFNFDLANLDMREFYREGLIGGRIHLLKDPLDTLEAARKKQFRLKIIHYAVCTLLLYILFKFVMMMYHLFF